VEDADALRKLSVTLLEEHGYQVLSAANGAAALELAQQDNRSIDLLLTDVIMPGLGGHALARRMGALRPGLKVLYMSGYTDSSIAQQGSWRPASLCCTNHSPKKNWFARSVRCWMRGSEVRPRRRDRYLQKKRRWTGDRSLVWC